MTVVGPRAPVRAAAGLARWLAGAAPRSARGAVTVALIADRRMRALNRAFRGVDHATDVLSFPASDAGPRAKPSPAAATSEAVSLGDLAIAIGVATRQAAQQGHALRTELRILALHGLLHLLGYDHERDRGTMRAVEDRLRRRAGLPSGLIGRSGRRTAEA